MKLEEVVPWGRNLQEYETMFSLTEEDLSSTILGCGDGPSSFNAQMTTQGYIVTSIDPIYSFSKNQLQERIDEVAREVIEQVRTNKEDFVWKNIQDVEALYQFRMGAMKIFLEDYEEGKTLGSYQNQMLPNLDFEENHFDLALSSHFLFLYSEHLDFEFHLKAILEMLRVAKEVRIFPLMTLKNEPSPYVEKIVEELEKLGYVAQVLKTNYEFQQGANKMLKVEHGTN